MSYRHTQASYVALAALDAVFVAVIAVMIVAGAPAIPILVTGAAFAALGVLIFGFSRLTVRVDPDVLTASFTWGWPRRSIALDEIAAIREVRNRWYHGWGLRKVPRGWMYNVWGLDAVELERRSGKVVRVGTDEPSALAAALAQASSGRLAA